MKNLDPRDSGGGECVAYLLAQGQQEGHEEEEHSPEGGSTHY